MAGKRRRSSKNKEKKEKGIPYFDYNLLFIVIFLLCFGLVMLYSSSAYTSAIKNHDSMHYLKLQIRNIVLGLIPMVFLAKVDYRYWKKLGFFCVYSIAYTVCACVCAKNRLKLTWFIEMDWHRTNTVPAFRSG